MRTARGCRSRSGAASAAAWAAARSCHSAELSGRPCDHAAADALIQAARVKSLDAIDANCSEREAIDLQYLGSFDLQADVINFCRDWPSAAESAVYGPAAGVPALSHSQHACVEAAADATNRLMQFTFRNRRQCMDRVASIALQAPNRAALLDLAARRIVEAHAALAAHLDARCAALPFTVLYGRPADAFIGDLGERADCIGAQFYIQDAVLCPGAVCGNGIVEPGERCDDGNTRDGDACSATCRQ